jgi:hypothetical protein
MNFFIEKLKKSTMKKLYGLTKCLPAGQGRVPDVKLNFIQYFTLKFSFTEEKYKYLSEKKPDFQEMIGRKKATILRRFFLL